MRRFLLTLFTAAVASLATATYRSPTLFRPIVPGEVEAHFSPKGGCTDAVVRSLRGARKNVRVQAYSFTNSAIAKALVEAHRRGVHVEMILDKSQDGDRYTAADFTAHAGIPTYIDAAHAIAHNKVMIIDDATIITGSFNFTKAAEESNAENLVIIHEAPRLAAQYLSNWNSHRSHSRQYNGHATRK